MARKRLTKEQKRQNEIAALQARLDDIYSGATGRAWDNENEWPGLEEASRIVPAVRTLFDPDNERSYLWQGHNLDSFECTRKLAERLHNKGFRA